jgi:TolB-like protein/class 3 adenylate cyclase/Tfp pilus assembly protein PilF
MADLPTGTVTLLFTDIEGSTRLWETHAEAMRAALARHDALLRHCIDDHHGHVFKTGGDAFCAAFHTAPDALAAALQAQRALQREPWPESAKLKVRMALHSGAVELRGGDYFGASLNRVARLLAAGHGGQTLLSESTHDLSRDHLPPLASVKALGAHGLKDLGRPESVFQLCHPELPQSFAPLKSLAAPVENETPSIAVLPFVNMSRDEENAYFADGLSEELLNVLAKIRGLRVASRTSAFSFKGKDVDIPTVAQKLNVATVLEGSVRKSGKRVRITAQLIEVASDSHLWSETYDRELDDIFAVQDDIAQSVVKELRAALLPEKTQPAASTVAAAEVRKAATGRSDNPEAFQLYLQGKFFGERVTQADTDKAIDLFKRALALDPDFALAWAGMSHVYQQQAGFGFAQIDEGYELAREAAQNALRLAPDLAEGHIQLGSIFHMHDWNWPAADASYRRAVELAPGSADALRAAAGLARILGQFDKARALMDQAIALDPLSARTHRQAAMIEIMADRLEDAAKSFQLALDLGSSVGLSHGFLAITRVLQGRAEEALPLAEAESHGVFRNLAFTLIHHALGHRAESDAALQTMIDQFGWTAAYQVAEAYAYRNDVEKAFEWLERAYQQRDPGVVYAATDPMLRAMHADPRWPPFVQRLGLG